MRRGMLTACRSAMSHDVMAEIGIRVVGKFCVSGGYSDSCHESHE
jgi:hypothetical protein